MFSFIIHITLALFLGICIGLERQFRQRATGLRTNTLVALGAAIFMLIASRIGGDAPGRIASYIISGIVFLGAGVILKDGASVRGLNTAATLWCTAAIGAFCGLGYIYEPLIGTAFIIGVHIFLRPVSNKIMRIWTFADKESVEYHYKFVACCKEDVENHIRVLFVQYIGNNNDLMLRSLSSLDADSSSSAIIEADIISFSKQDATIEKIASFLTLESGIYSIKWKIDNIDTHT
ncbi:MULTISPECIES: MgtC/SapB family protein [Dysgonomonas]|uniref:Protein MgtC n=1 Tax=Dysgonomonas gadei ATCC BAA-286 TaxID=742766 RepID=F5IXA0_9BACT|nr:MULTISPECIES: MgtC/SapB family protein [Dysgonomonas]EGK02083.1 hypothetical protein HMPREF9455_01717 [Dysgonomonas gadei ATCC BAA-286]MBF0651899.1 MgtC/SapB family protein [Dysgonomonas sp. GY75]